MATLTLLSAATATNSPPSSHATGTIVAVAVANLVDTETFVVSDGVSSKTFEFDVNGTGVTAGRVQVNVSTDTTSAHVRDRIITAINSQTGWNIRAFIAAAATVGLKNTVPGSAGNVTITEAVADAGFTVSGMTGGANNVGVDLRGTFSNHDRAELVVGSVAGYGTMDVTIRLWCYTSALGMWIPIGVGADATKGTINNLTAMGETSANLIAHGETVSGLSAYERAYAEVVAISGTSTAVSAYLIPHGDM